MMTIRTDARALGVFLALLTAVNTVGFAAPARARMASTVITPGMLMGSFSVSERGTAKYDIVVPAPPGTGDVTPRLGLSYSNGTRDGMMGVGFQLMGLPVVQRTGANIAQDGYRGGVNYDANDRFAYSGQRLIVVSGSDGGDGSVHRTEVETWQRFVSHDVCGSGPCWWSMTTDKGVTYEFGHTSDSRVLAVAPDGSQLGGTVRAWAINRIRDLNGNAMTMTYSASPSGADDLGQYYPLGIDYTSNDAAGLQAGRHVTFTYEKRPDPFVSYTGGGMVRTSSRLTSVTSTVGGVAAPSITLTYETGASTGRSRVKSVTECSGDGTLCYAPTTFTWTDASLTFTPPKSWLQNDFITGWSSTDPRLMAPAAGTGRTDIVGFRLDTQVSTAQPDGSFSKATSWNSGFGRNSGWTGPNTPRALGDVNGDGKADVVGFNYGGVEVGVSTGHSFDKSLWSSAPFPYFGYSPSAGGWIADRDPRMLADVTGEGRDAIVGFKDKVYVSTSTGTSFSTPVVWNDSDFTGSSWWANPRQQLRYLADVTGDGRADVVGFGPSSVIVGVSTGHSFSTTDWPQNATGFPYFTAAQGWVNGRNPRMLIDVNGDGLADIVGFKNGTWVSFSTGRGFLPPVKWSDGFSIESTPFWSADLPRQFADVNGSGLPSIVGYSKTGVVVGLNTGSSFSTTSWNQSSLPTFVGGKGAPIFSTDVAGQAFGDAVDIGGAVGAPISVSVATPAGPQSDLVTRVLDGLGGTLDITYAPMTDAAVYTPGAASATDAGITSFSGPLPYSYDDISSDFPVRNVVGGPIYLVKHVVESTDPKRQAARYSYATDYSYADARLDNRSQRWLGFAHKQRIFEPDGRATIEYMNQAFPLTGMISKREIRCASGAPDPRCTAGALMSVSAMDYATSVTATGTGPTNPNVYMVRQRSQRQDHFTYGTWNDSTLDTYTYDAYGNPTIENFVGSVDQSGTPKPNPDVPPTLTCKDYYNNAPAGAPWVLGFVEHVKVTSNTSCGTVGTFASGDLTLEQLAYDTAAGTMNILSDGKWAQSANGFLTFNYGYDAFGNRTSTRNPDGQTSTSAYDSTYHAFLTSETSPQIGTDHHTMSFAYNFDPRFSDRTATIDQNGVAMLTCLDGLGRIASKQRQPNDPTTPTEASCVTSGTGSNAKVVTTERSTWTDDGAGHIVAQNDSLQTWPTATQPGTFRRSRSFLDPRARVYGFVEESDPTLGAIASCTVYDGYDREPKSGLPFRSKTDPDCGANGSTPFWNTHTYDVVGRVVQRTRPTGADGAKTATDVTHYDSYLVATQTLASGSSANYARTLRYGLYENEREVRSITVNSDNGATTTIDRDGLGRIIGTTAPATTGSPSGITTTFTLDGVGRQVKAVSPDRGTITYDYGATEELQHRVDARGTIDYQYDAVGRLTGENVSDGTTLAYGYDDPNAGYGIGERTSAYASAANSAGPVTQTYGYDPSGNLRTRKLTLNTYNATPLGAGTGTLTPHTYTTTTTFDPLQRPTNVVYPDGRVMQRAYAFGNLASVAINGSSIANIPTYSALDKPMSYAYGSGATESRAYSPAGLLSSMDVRAQGAEIAQRSNAWNEIDELTTQSDGAKVGGKDLGSTYGYSSLRLTSSNGPYGAQSFGYDGAGNLTRRVADGTTTDFTYNNFQISAGVAANSAVYSATYDGAGDMLTRTVAGQQVGFAYDGTGDMTSFSAPAESVIETYGYDADGGRVWKRDISGGLTAVYADPEYQETIDAQGHARSTIVVRDGEGVLATNTTGDPSVTGTGVPPIGTLYLHRDQVQSTVATSTDGGSVGTLMAFAPYGSPYVAQGPRNFRQLFTGDEQDGSGLYAVTSRYLDPATGRFTAPDRGTAGPLELQDTLNTYAYVGGRPTSLTDPSGQQIELVVAAIAEVGVAIGEAATAAEATAAVAETGAAVSEAGAAAASVGATETGAASAASESIAATETLASTSAQVDSGVEATASTAARTAFVPETELTASTALSEEASVGTSVEQTGQLADLTSYEAESTELQCPSPCRFTSRLWRQVDRYNPWSDRPVTLYRALRNPQELQEIEQGTLRSPNWRATLTEDRPTSIPGFRFLGRFVHSFDSTGSNWVSTTSDLNVAQNFAGNGARIYQFEVPRYQLNYAWHNIYGEAEMLAENGTRVTNLRQVYP